ncbi:hypothetical protein GH810_00305 [Acetobacterium paludosum]|uniref:Uncharacterized protein n=1 Tax=Acetobacterium paludosum TaxID=52693 RepID=A0A923KV97_9FIRM|nr:hypothetical protein [Acetobacterium paludosum]MBC3886758.1 hypothetical protein [Acetobacterium paludosum]
MTQNSVQLALSELRDESQVKDSEALFKKELFGGYNVKQVTEYIESLTVKLHDAEESCNFKIDEFVSITTKLKQERDLYGEMFNMCKNSKIEMEAQNQQLKNELNEQKISEQECADLKDQLKQLELMVEDLNGELENYAKGNVTEDHYEKLLAENENKMKKYEKDVQERNELLAENEKLKKQYEEAIQEKRLLPFEKKGLREQNEATHEKGALFSENKDLQEQYKIVIKERNTLLVENNILANQNKRLTVNLWKSNEKNEELRAVNIKTKLKLNKMSSEFESRSDVYSQKYQRNIDKISESMKNTMNILKYEIEDADLLFKRNFSDISLTNEDTRLIREQAIKKKEV